MKLCEVKNEHGLISGVVMLANPVEEYDGVFAFYREPQARAFWKRLLTKHRGSSLGCDLLQCEFGLVVKPWVILVGDLFRATDETVLAVGSSKEQIMDDFGDEIKDFMYANKILEEATQVFPLTTKFDF